ncbi:Hypothetical predicted protein [Paramuricea clavata]|uniref:Uncharacterized protein n=1 Tax=Paramuricea clavata TaxID=317549 RepID=A0A7D9D6I2_PARCT|nr:Hypothetical predicted protein [Paramuricea clavata]
MENIFLGKWKKLELSWKCTKMWMFGQSTRMLNKDELGRVILSYEQEARRVYRDGGENDGNAGDDADFEWCYALGRTLLNTTLTSGESPIFGGASGVQSIGQRMWHGNRHQQQHKLHRDGGNVGGDDGGNDGVVMGVVMVVMMVMVVVVVVVLEVLFVVFVIFVVLWITLSSVEILRMFLAVGIILVVMVVEEMLVVVMVAVAVIMVVVEMMVVVVEVAKSVGGGGDGGNYGGDGGGGRAGGPVHRHLRRFVDHYGLGRNIEDVSGRGGNRIGGDNVGDGRRGDANDGGGNDGGGGTPVLKTQIQHAVEQIVRDYLGGIELQEEEPVGERNRMLTKAELTRIIISYEEGRRLHRDGGNVGGDDGGNDGGEVGGGDDGRNYGGDGGGDDGDGGDGGGGGRAEGPVHRHLRRFVDHYGLGRNIEDVFGRGGNRIGGDVGDGRRGDANDGGAAGVGPVRRVGRIRDAAGLGRAVQMTFLVVLNYFSFMAGGSGRWWCCWWRPLWLVTAFGSLHRRDPMVLIYLDGHGVLKVADKENLYQVRPIRPGGHMTAQQLEAVREGRMKCAGMCCAWYYQIHFLQLHRDGGNVGGDDGGNDGVVMGVVMGVMMVMVVVVVLEVLFVEFVVFVIFVVLWITLSSVEILRMFLAGGIILVVMVVEEMLVVVMVAVAVIMVVVEMMVVVVEVAKSVGGGGDGGNYGGDGGGGRAGGPVHRHLRRFVDHYGLGRNIEDVFGRGGNRIGGDNVGDGRRGDANDGGGNDGGGGTPVLKTQIQHAVEQIVRDYLGGIELQEEEPVRERNRMLTKAELARIIISYEEEGRRLHRDGGNVGGDDGGNDGGEVGGGDDGGNYGGDGGGDGGGGDDGGDGGGGHGGDGGGGAAGHGGGGGGGGGGGRAEGPVHSHLRRFVDHYGLGRNIEDVFGRGGNCIGGDNVGDGRRGDANDGGGNDGDLKVL